MAEIVEDVTYTYDNLKCLLAGRGQWLHYRRASSGLAATEYVVAANGYDLSQFQSRTMPRAIS